MSFLPINKKEMIELGWDRPDFVLVTGDAYCDHPSFGHAIISRMLEKYGYKVCILSQPNYKNIQSFTEFGEPRLGFLVTSGNIDSMVNHYTVNKRKRKKDHYTPGGKTGKRPDRATIKYSQLIKQAYPDSFIIIGGIEASLRRLSHYDYWDNHVRKSILLDSNADLLVYGMAEKTIIDIADYLDSGLDIKDIIFLRGTVWKTNDGSRIPNDAINLPNYKEVLEKKKNFAKSFKVQYENTDAIISKPLVERYKHNIIIQNTPQLPLTSLELDDVYKLPYMRSYHPVYNNIGHISAMDEIKHSIIANRGCFGSCSFCALTFHQGRVIQSRSKQSIINEAKLIIDDPSFKGYIHDVGGPTANFYLPSCEKQIEKGTCKYKQCLDPKPCTKLNVNHTEYLDILRTLRSLDGVKKVFVRSGLRYDYMMYDKNDTFFHELVKHHISGQLKVAPEHISDNVLRKMGKPSRNLYDKFTEKYNNLNKKYKLNQYLVPYLMSSHPGSTLNDAIMLAEYVRDMGYNPEQVQDFYPTPGTLSTCMYYTGLDPRTMEEVYVPKTRHEKEMQRALIQYRNPRNYKLVHEALTTANRFDLIGNKKHCLIKEKRY